MNPERSDRLARWDELICNYVEMKGMKIRGELGIFRLSLVTFDQNFNELECSIEAMKPLVPVIERTFFEFSDHSDPLLETVSRHLQNFTAAAMTLVDQTRTLYNEWYKNSGLIPEYQERVDRDFKSNGRHHFVKGLRNSILHCRMPTLSYEVTRSYRTGGEIVSFEVHFKKEQLIKSFDWSAIAHDFILNSPEKISLRPMFSQYHEEVMAFHSWFTARQQEVHREPIEALAVVETELRAITVAERKHFEKTAGQEQVEALPG